MPDNELPTSARPPAPGQKTGADNFRSIAATVEALYYYVICKISGDRESQITFTHVLRKFTFAAVRRFVAQRLASGAVAHRQLSLRHRVKRARNCQANL